ncbi:MAG: hypothetical protein Q8R76_07190 [Candidatus Omnitrophota bacterium]|nr:hypothetical protein [Candidatus Omnitrophota bacterium]
MKDVEHIAAAVSRELSGTKKGRRDITEYRPETLEQCLMIPFQTFAIRSSYPSLASKASVLFYLIMKNQPFRCGNQRMALVSWFLFLFKNKKWLEVEPKDLHQFAVWIAQSPANAREGALKAIEDFLKHHMSQA